MQLRNHTNMQEERTELFIRQILLKLIYNPYRILRKNTINKFFKI